MIAAEPAGQAPYVFEGHLSTNTRARDPATLLVFCQTLERASPSYVPRLM